jgi:multiple sugar transport system substrate-binding protein
MADSDVQKVLIDKMSTADLLKSWDAYWTKKWNG